MSTAMARSRSRLAEFLDIEGSAHSGGKRLHFTVKRSQAQSRMDHRPHSAAWACYSDLSRGCGREPKGLQTVTPPQLKPSCRSSDNRMRHCASSAAERMMESQIAR